MNVRIKIISIFLLVGLAASGVVFYLSRGGTLTRGALEDTNAQDVTTHAIFDAKKTIWVRATSTAAWQTRDSAASFVFAGKIWTMGGLNGNLSDNPNPTVEYWKVPHFNDIWSSSDGAVWNEEVKEAAWPVRRSMSVLLFKNSLWMFGGWSPISGYGQDIWNSKDAVTWKRATTTVVWPAREGQMAEIFLNKMWLIGGVNYDARETKNDVWFSEDGLAWTEASGTVPWSSRWDHATAVFKNKLYVIGGMDLQGRTFRDVWATADGETWELITDSPPWEARQGHSLVVWRDKLWMVGRLDDAGNGGVNDLWFTEDGMTWEKTDVNPPWRGREDHAVLTFGDKIFVFGGMDSDWKWRNDVWYSVGD